MTLELLPLLQGVPAGEVLSGSWAIVRWVADAAVWLLDHGLLVALATGAAAWIAWQAHQREERREREREAANDARIEALAFALIHEMELWRWDPGPPVYPTTEERAEYALRAVPSMEERFQEMLALAPEASSEQKVRVQKAATAFYSCIGLLRFASRGEPDAASPGDLVTAARENKDEALRHLTEASESLLEVDLDRIGVPDAPRSR